MMEVLQTRINEVAVLRCPNTAAKFQETYR
jgi:hypothetical protein